MSVSERRSWGIVSSFLSTLVLVVNSTNSYTLVSVGGVKESYCSVPKERFGRGLPCDEEKTPKV